MSPRCCIWLAHRWRLPKVMWGLLIFELPLTIVALLLVGIADGSTYRHQLWQVGSDNGFNSNPNEILYDYANYRPVHYPLLWSKYFIDFNVVVVVLSMFILLVKSIMFSLGAFLPILSIVVHAAEIAIYAVAIGNQTTPDLSNRDVPNLQKNLPWYLSKGCGYATKATKGYCQQAVATFAIMLIMLVVFVAYFGVAIHSTNITREEKMERLADWEEEKDLKQYEENYDPEEEWEARRQEFAQMPRTPATPWSNMNLPLTTPRTTAFNQLSGSESGPSAINTTGNTSARPLAFRAQYGDSL